jgi:predicted MFS family arabinose efflux permease
MLADVTPPGLHGRAFGFHRGADHLGAMLGSLVAWYALTRHAHVREVIGWSVVPGVAAVLVLAAVLRGAPQGAEVPAAPAAPSNGALSSVVSLPVTTPILLLALLALCRIPETLLLLRLQDLGVSVAAIPLAWAGLHIVRSAASYPGGWLNDRLGSAALVGMGAAIFALCLALLGKPLAPALAVGTLLLFGLAAAATEPAERALVATLSPRARGAGFGAYHALTGVAALPAGVAFGWLYQRFGGSDAMWASGALVGVVGVVWMIRGARPGAR